LECCRLNPPEVRFCRTCGRLLHSQGTLRNPEKGWEYEVIDVLVQGGMSTTYRVYNRQVHRLAVLKEINADLSRKAKARELFMREAQTLQALQHPGIPKFYDFFCTDEHYSLVMELIHGPTLEEIEPMDVAQAVGWILETCEVLSYLHERGVIHRDIKPANLILRHNPRRIVLIDFGAVKEVGSAPGTRIATPGYGAPEQNQGRPCLQSDFYGIGTTLVYLLTRQSPTHFYNPRAQRLMGLEEAGLPPALVSVILAATALDPHQRPQNCTDLMAALRPFAT
jgi:serine/threonine protein kinase